MAGLDSTAHVLARAPPSASLHACARGRRPTPSLPGLPTREMGDTSSDSTRMRGLYTFCLANPGSITNLRGRGGGHAHDGVVRSGSRHMAHVPHTYTPPPRLACCTCTHTHLPARGQPPPIDDAAQWTTPTQRPAA